MLWPLLTRSACIQPATVVATTNGEDASLDSIISIVVCSYSHCGGGRTDEGAALASVLLVGVGSSILCEGGHVM
jgi:hypothetical protein